MKTSHLTSPVREDVDKDITDTKGRNNLDILDLITKKIVLLRVQGQGGPSTKFSAEVREL